MSWKTRTRGSKGQRGKRFRTDGSGHGGSRPSSNMYSRSGNASGFVKLPIGSYNEAVENIQSLRKEYLTASPARREEILNNLREAETGAEILSRNRNLKMEERKEAELIQEKYQSEIRDLRHSGLDHDSLSSQDDIEFMRSMNRDLSIKGYESEVIDKTETGFALRSEHSDPSHDLHFSNRKEVEKYVSNLTANSEPKSVNRPLSREEILDLNKKYKGNYSDLTKAVEERTLVMSDSALNKTADNLEQENFHLAAEYLRDRYAPESGKIPSEVNNRHSSAIVLTEKSRRNPLMTGNAEKLNPVTSYKATIVDRHGISHHLSGVAFADQPIAETVRHHALVQGLGEINSISITSC